VDAALARVQLQLKEYNELCSLRSHDSDAPVSKEQLLLEICRTCTARYHMVLEHAKNNVRPRAVSAMEQSREGGDVVGVTFGPDWWDRVQHLSPY
jgi:hypothetical protein